jgi:hypothetical protein
MQRTLEDLDAEILDSKDQYEQDLDTLDELKERSEEMNAFASKQ